MSAGNHAMAVGYAARALGTTAKVVMPKTASPARIEGSRAYGAEVVLVEDVHAAFAKVKEIAAELKTPEDVGPLATEAQRGIVEI